MIARAGISVSHTHLVALTACVAALGAGPPGPAVRSSPGGQQGQVPSFQSRVELVRLPVAVVDRDGDFVHGLEAGDFVLEIDGLERPVAVATEVDLGGPPVDPRMRPETPSAAEGRSFVLFLDTVFQRPQKLDVCIHAARYLLDERLMPADRVALAAFGRRGVVLVEPFTTDRATIAAALEGLHSQWSWQIERVLGGRVDDIFDAGEIPLLDRVDEPLSGRELTPELVPDWHPDTNELAELYLAGLHRLGIALQAEQGRKQLVLLSPGFGRASRPGSLAMGFSAVPGIPDRIVDPRVLPVDYGTANVLELMRLTAEALRDGNVVVHALSTAALVPGGGRRGLHFLWYFSDETGGTRRFHTHHLEADAARAESLSRHYYLLGYRRLPGDPPRVNVDVRVRRGGLLVRAPTRMALPPGPAERSDLQRWLLNGDGYPY